MNRHPLFAVTAVALVLAGAACGPDASTTADAGPTSAVPATAAAGANASSAETAKAPSASSGNGGASAGSAGGSSAGSSTSAAEPVEASDFTTTGGAGEGLYFTTGALRCGITQSITGCQSTALVKNVPECNDPATKAPFVALVASEPSGNCTTQGVFIAEPSRGKARELPVGQKLSAHGATCEVVAAGSVRCSNALGSLVANPQQFTLKVKA